MCDGPIPRPEEPYCLCVCHRVRSGVTMNLYTYNEKVERDRLRKE